MARKASSYPQVKITRDDIERRWHFLGKVSLTQLSPDLYRYLLVPLLKLLPHLQGVLMTKRTFQPNVRRRAKKHGFRARMATRAGRAVLSARRAKGRARISA